jgi:hypothetical protein
MSFFYTYNFCISLHKENGRNCHFAPSEDSDSDIPEVLGKKMVSVEGMLMRTNRGRMEEEDIRPDIAITIQDIKITL